MISVAERNEAAGYLATLHARLTACEIAGLPLADQQRAALELADVFKSQRLLDILHSEATAQVDAATKAALIVWRKANVRGAPPTSLFESDPESQAAKTRRAAIYFTVPNRLTAQSAIAILELAVKAIDAKISN